MSVQSAALLAAVAFVDLGSDFVSLLLLESLVELEDSLELDEPELDESSAAFAPGLEDPGLEDPGLEEL